MKINLSTKYIALWQTACFTISILFVYIILKNHTPNFLRPLSISLRTGFGLIIPGISILLYLAFRVPGRLGHLLSMIVTVSLYVLPLAGLWASGQTQTTVLNGIIPLYDANSYYIDALKLINGSKFSIFSARRPLFPGLLSVLLSLTNHNLMASLAILTALVGFSCYFAAREIQRTYGSAVSTFIIIIVFLFFRAHSGISMSENLGITLGVLGFALLWMGATSKSRLYLWAGLFVTTLALNARAGAFFMLPILALWVGWLFRHDNQWISWRSAFSSIIAIILGFALNLILTRLIAIPSGTPFANFSYTLYGLASGGKSWAYIFDAHPEIFAIQEPEQTKRIYELAFELIRTKPLQTIQGAFYNWSMLFSDSWYNIYSYVGGENWTITVFARWILYLLSIAGIYAWFQDRSNSVKSLIMVSFIGVFISVPFLPPTDAYRMRPYAASIIILASLPALGLSYLLEKSKLKLLSEPLEIFPASSAPLIFSSTLVLAILAGPIILKSVSNPVSLKPTSCTNKNSDFVLARFDEGTYINIKRQSQYFLDWMPNFHKGQFQENAHSLADINLINWAESLEPPTTLFLSLDFNTNKKALVALKTDVIPETGKYYQFCGNFETSPFLSSFRIFYAFQTLPLSP